MSRLFYLFFFSSLYSIIRLILKTSELIPFHCVVTRQRHNEPNHKMIITKHFWINLIRHRSQKDNKMAYFVAKESWIDQAEVISSPFKPFTITFNTDESADALLTGSSHIITRNFIPIRLTAADSAAIAQFKSINWKTIIAVREYEFQALRFFGKTFDNQNQNLTLPTAALYIKRVYRDLDTPNEGNQSPPLKRSRATPAQSFALSRVNNSYQHSTGNQPVQPMQPVQPVRSAQPAQPAQSAQPAQPAQPAQLAQPVQTVHTVHTAQIVQCDISADIQLNDSQSTNTIPAPKATPTPPPTTLTEQVNNSNNVAHMRKQRDFPTPGLLNEQHFQHIARQLNRTHPCPFPNIYLRLTIVVNHIYYVLTQDDRHLQTHACITLIDGDRLLHFLPIKSPSERHRALWKNFSKANAQYSGYGTWIPLKYLPDLALLSKTIPMREHLALITYIKSNY